MLVHHPASERKQVLTERMFGVSSEFINLKKLSNFAWLLQRSHGRCTRKWSRLPKSSTRVLNFLTKLSTLSQVSSMMQLLRSTILKLGSLDMVPGESLCHAQTALISNQEASMWDFNSLTQKIRLTFIC